MIKKILTTSLVVGLLFVDSTMALSKNVTDEGDIIPNKFTSIEFKRLVTEATEGTIIRVVGAGFTPRESNYIVELSNDSWVVYNKKNKTIHFQPTELGDWDYEFDNIKDAMNCISMYSQRHSQITKEI